MRIKPLQALLPALIVAGLAAAASAHADTPPVWQKDARGRIADAVRVDVYDKKCPTLTFRLGRPGAVPVKAVYEPMDYGCKLPDSAASRKVLPAALHTLVPPGDVSFAELYVQVKPRTVAGKTVVKVLRAPAVWLDLPPGAWVGPQELGQANVISLDSIDHICIGKPTRRQDCAHQPQVLAALKTYLAAVDTLYAAVPHMLPDVRYFGPGDTVDTNLVWFDDLVYEPGFKSPYATPSDLESLMDLDNNLRLFKAGFDGPVELIDRPAVEFVLKPELDAARAAWANYQATLGGKKLHIRLRNAAGTESRATELSGC